MSLYKSNLYLRDLDKLIKDNPCIKDLYRKKVLITGVTGSIGSFMMDVLLRASSTEDAQIQIVAMGRNIKKMKERFSQVDDSNVSYIEFDMKKVNALPDMSIDYVIHIAGNAHPGTFNTDPTGTILGNIFGTNQLLEYAKEHGAKRFLFISTGEVYGKGDINLSSYDESYSGSIDSMSPRACYPNSKRAAETLCSSYQKQFGLNVIVARLCHTYGPTANDTDIRAQAQFLRNAVNREDIVMNSPGEQVRSYCYVADCVAGLLTVLIKGTPGNAYNISNENSIASIAEFAQEAARQAEKKVIFRIPSEEDLANRTPIEKQVLNNNKLKELGWQGAYTLSEGIQHSIQIISETKGI